jgi:hypothetical protein
MVTLTSNVTTNTRIEDGEVAYHFKPSNKVLISAQNSVNFSSEKFEKLMAEGYKNLAKEHLKFAKDCIYLASEILPDSE